MYQGLSFLILLALVCPSTAGYSCPQISRFYIDCSNLYTINESMALCSQLGMSILNLTNSTADTNLVQLLQSINCTAHFWFANGAGTILVGDTGTTTGGLLCSVTSLLSIYCVSTAVVQATTVCMRTNQMEFHQKCSNNDPNQRPDLQKFTFVRTTTYTSSYKTFRTGSRSQCASFCTKTSQCIGRTYNQSTCTLYS